MHRTMLLRLTLDGLAAVLLVAALAYYWLDNLSHEVIGLAVFALIGLHGWFNRRWYLMLLRGRQGLRRGLAAGINLGFLAVMAVVLVTGLLVSRSVFGFLGLQAGYTAREVHMFAAYWAVAFLGAHLGLNWGRVMLTLRGACGIRQASAARRWALRAGAALIAVQGLAASTEMAFGTRLSLGYAMDMWDFNAQAPRFFLNYGCILGLYAAVTHYVQIILHRAPQAVRPRG